MTNHTDVQIVESLYKAFKANDKGRLNELIADDCQWEVGGNQGGMAGGALLSWPISHAAWVRAARLRQGPGHLRGAPGAPRTGPSRRPHRRHDLGEPGPQPDA